VRKSRLFRERYRPRDKLYRELLCRRKQGNSRRLRILRKEERNDTK